MTVDSDISRVHPTYAQLAPWWTEGLDFYRAGVHILQPQRVVGQIPFAVERTSPAGLGAAPEAPEGETSLAEYKPIGKKSYLWSHERESSNRFDDRQKRLGHFPLFQPVCDIHTDAVMRKGLQFEGITPAWEPLIKDADLRGGSLDMLTRNALSWALAMSRMHAVVDFTKLDAAPRTVAEQRAWGVRPWINLITPLDLINWALDEEGNFLWAVVRELEPDWREPGQPDPGRQYWYRMWDRDGWILYGQPRDAHGAQGSMQVMDSGRHDLGRVPITTLWTDHDPGKTMFTQSVFASLQRMDRVVLNLLSLLHEIDYGQTFTTWFFPDEERQGIGSVEMGIHNAVTGPTAPVALSPDEQMAAGLMTRIKEHIHLARMASGASRGSAEQSKEGRSGEAYSYESEQKRHQMSRLAQNTEEWVNETLDVAAQWLGVPTALVPQAHLPTNFDMKTLGRKVNEALTFSKLDVGAGAMVYIKRNLGEQLLKEWGAGNDDIEGMLSEIDEHTQKLMEDPKDPLSGGPAFGPEDGAKIRDDAARDEEKAE